MTIRIAFPYKLRDGQKKGGVISSATGCVIAWSSLKTKACTTESPRWRPVLDTKYIETGVNAVGPQSAITPLDPPYEHFCDWGARA